jgi:hypothetical protein
MRGHVLSIAVVMAGAVAVVGVFTFARPTSHPSALPPPPDAGLPYTRVTYSADDAKRAFAAVGVKLLLRTHQPVPAHAAPIIDLSTKNLVVAVDAFGDAKKVAAAGFSDYFSLSNGHWVHAPRSCESGAIDAERWRGNIRVIVSCTRAGTEARTWLRLANNALGRL